jgi:hypothetical protein
MPFMLDDRGDFRIDYLDGSHHGQSAHWTISFDSWRALDSSRGETKYSTRGSL